jgi:signal transduction histidine kinase
LWVLLIGIGLTGVLVGGGGYFLTRQMLNPIHKITEKADQISHSNLGERVTVHHKEDELGQLSIVLNNLLERLQKAFDSQQQFMADAAHELKTPLAILRAHWEGELNNPGLPLEMKEKLVGDIETISRLNHLINNLLMLTRTEAPDSNLDLVPLELDKLLREVISDADILARARNQEILIVEMSPAVTRGDRGRLYQLFFNLVDNAGKYTPEGGKIWVSLRLEDRWALAEIRDNGPGIPAEDLPHIFKRFYRVKKDRSRKTGGSGLGLAICQLIAESHKGSIEAESTIGAGSTFRVKLPVIPPLAQVDA